MVEGNGEETLWVTKPTKEPYIEAAEEAQERAFQSLELISTTYVAAGTKVGLSDPTVPSGRAVAQRIKVTDGITG